MTDDRPILDETTTPDGVRVVLFEDTWLLHILDRTTVTPSSSRI
jgi:hypothetical protein